ncbi:MAG: hypothetical protein ACKVHE_23450 [Planctomycetales bacterium]
MRKRNRWLLVLTAVAAAGCWYTVTSRSIADDAGLTRQQEDTQELINAEKKRHAAQLKNLDAAKKALKDAGVNTKPVDALAASEDDVHRARIDELHHRLDPDATNLQRTVLSELRDLRRAIGSLNQSYEIPPVRLKNANGTTTTFTGGSKFVDYQDPIDHQVTEEDDEKSAAQASSKSITNGKGEEPLAADAKEPAQPNSEDGLLGEVPVETAAK